MLSLFILDCWTRRFFRDRDQVKLGLDGTSESAILILISWSPTDSNCTNNLALGCLEKDTSWERSHLSISDSHHRGHLAVLARLVRSSVFVSEHPAAVFGHDASICLSSRKFWDTHWGTAIHSLGNQNEARSIQDVDCYGGKRISLATSDHSVRNEISLL